MPRPRTPDTPPTDAARVALNRSKREAAGARRISVMLSAEGAQALALLAKRPGWTITGAVELGLLLLAAP